MYTINQLEKYANKFLQDNYNMKMEIPLRLNGRLKSTCGWFKYRPAKKEAVCVELNKYFVEKNEPSMVLDILRHELVHYALFAKGKPHCDGDTYFENELNRLGIVSQSTINKYNIKSKPVTISIYKCKECSYEFKKRRALSSDGRYHRCGCGGNLESLGKRVTAS